MPQGADATLIVQTGDYAEAYDRFAAGGGETFRDQRRSVRFVADEAARRPVTVVAISAMPYDRVLEPGLRAIGLEARHFHGPRMGQEILRSQTFSRIILRSPVTSVLRAATASGIATFACFADLFRSVAPRELPSRQGMRLWMRNRRLARLLAQRNVVAVGNNGLQAGLSLERVLGVPRNRILLHEHAPLAVDPPDPGRARDGLLYVGVVSEAKGVGDLIVALARSRTRASLTIVGDGPDRARLAGVAADAGIGGRVRFVGKWPSDAVRDAMRAASALVVPSRHAYGEGMPNVIAEGLSTRTPLILSDHPAFAGAFCDRATAVIARASDPDDLARAIDHTMSDASLRARLSEAAPDALAAIDIGHSIYDLWNRFLEDAWDRTGWVEQMSLAGEGARWT